MMTGAVDELELKAGKLHTMMIVGYLIYAIQFMLIMHLHSLQHVTSMPIGTVNKY